MAVKPKTPAEVLNSIQQKRTLYLEDFFYSYKRIHNTAAKREIVQNKNDILHTEAENTENIKNTSDTASEILPLTGNFGKSQK